MILPPLMLAITDAVRWWGAMAGMICVAEIYRWFHHPEQVARLDLELAIFGKLALGIFLILAGSAIPLTNRLERFTSSNSSFLIIMLIAWICVSSSGWLFVISRAHKGPVMKLTSIFTICATVLASMLTAHA